MFFIIYTVSDVSESLLRLKISTISVTIPLQLYNHYIKTESPVFEDTPPFGGEHLGNKNINNYLI